MRPQFILKFLTLILFFFTVPASVFAQVMLQGKVLDAESRKPVTNASVYFNNTQVGSVTNDKGQFKLYAPRLYNDLVISAVGYERAIVNVTESNSSYTVLLKEKANNLMEVRISSGKNNWQKWGDLFFRLLLGKNSHITSSFKILNPEDIKFYYDEQEHYLEASSDKAILIKNALLDYTIHLDIEDFTYNIVDDELNYNSAVYFEGINKIDKRRQLILSNNYLGSKMHFYRSLYSKTLESENFSLYRYHAVKNLKKESVSRTVQLYRVKKMAAGAKGDELLKLSDNRDSAAYYKKILLQDDVLKWDTTQVDYRQYLTYDSLNHKMTFKFSDTLMVVYRRSFDANLGLFRSHVGNAQQATRVVELKTLLYLTNKDGVQLDPSGFCLPNAILMTGNMGDRRLAEQLPYDYVNSP
ncbi:carboxypeptidase-like regulatory domain-containing protein [Pedobacter sp.]|uniref:carboxypeptidase-like regulatory domain-containing protein n=1 Tax=Pedobacter sp. TaxID=1411316 RepID=UPI0031E34B93